MQLQDSQTTLFYKDIINFTNVILLHNILQTSLPFQIHIVINKRTLIHTKDTLFNYIFFNKSRCKTLFFQNLYFNLQHSKKNYAYVKKTTDILIKSVSLYSCF